MIKQILGTALLCSVFLGPIVLQADDTPVIQSLPDPGDKVVPCPSEFKAAVESLSHQVDEWHNAVLIGDKSRAVDCEAEIERIIQEDLERSRATVRYLARKPAADVNQDQADKSGEVGQKLMEAPDAYKMSLTALKIKEQLSLSLSKTDAFSNKYRLVSDYIDVLRKQLDMPKVKLAGEKTRAGSYPTGKAVEQK